MPSRAGRRALGTDNIVISSSLARKLKVRVGDSVRVHTLLGTEVLGLGGLDDELMSSVAYVALDTAEAWIPLHVRVFNKLLLTVASGQSRQVETYLYTLSGAASVQLKSAVRASWQSLLGFYYLFMDVILIFAFATAFSILFNTMMVNVLEQQRELATMRSIGTPASRVAMLMITEILALWMLALLPGLLLGTWVAKGMGEAMQSDLFSVEVTVSPGSYLLSAAGILITMILAALPAIRRINRLNLAVATKVIS